MAESLKKTREKARTCRDCPLWANATQTGFGAGFVGPAGRLLDRAAKALIGRDFKVSVQRGQLVKSPLAAYVFATFHPSALLRLREEDKEAAFDQLVKDLKLIKKALGRP